MLEEKPGIVTLREPVPNQWFRQILLRAFTYGQTHRDDYVGVGRLLTAIIGGDQPLASHELRASGVRDQVPSEVVVLMSQSPSTGNRAQLSRLGITRAAPCVLPSG